MQNKIKRIIGIVLSLIIVFSSLPFAMAANGDANDSPLEIGIKTNKESYSALEIAEFTVTITNVGDYKVENISTEVLLDKITPVGVKSEIVKEIESLESGENIELNFRAMLDTETANMGFLEKLIIKIIKFFIGTINAADNDFDDGRDLKEEKLVFRFGDNDVSGNVRVWYDTGLDSSDVDEVLAYYSDAVAKTNKITKTEKMSLKSEITGDGFLSTALAVIQPIIEDVIAMQGGTWVGDIPGANVGALRLQAGDIAKNLRGVIGWSVEM